MWIVKAAVAGVILLAVYAGECWVYPFAKCSWCSGTGRRDSNDGKHWGDCRHCRGAGRRIRVGRWLFNQVADRRRKARDGEG